MQAPSTLAKYYAAADVLLYPTKADSFGLVPTEAMACGTAVVSFGVGAIPELIDDGENGFLVKPDDHNALVETIVLAFTKDKRREYLGNYACRKIESCFTLDSMIQRYSELYGQA